MADWDNYIQNKKKKAYGNFHEIMSFIRHPKKMIEEVWEDDDKVFVAFDDLPENKEFSADMLALNEGSMDYKDFISKHNSDFIETHFQHDSDHLDSGAFADKWQHFMDDENDDGSSTKAHSDASDDEWAENFAQQKLAKGKTVIKDDDEVEEKEYPEKNEKKYSPVKPPPASTFGESSSLQSEASHPESPEEAAKRENDIRNQAMLDKALKEAEQPKPEIDLFAPILSPGVPKLTDEQLKNAYDEVDDYIAHLKGKLEHPTDKLMREVAVEGKGKELAAKTKSHKEGKAFEAWKAAFHKSQDDKAKASSASAAPRRSQRKASASAASSGAESEAGKSDFESADEYESADEEKPKSKSNKDEEKPKSKEKKSVKIKLSETQEERASNKPASKEEKYKLPTIVSTQWKHVLTYGDPAKTMPSAKESKAVIKNINSLIGNVMKESGGKLTNMVTNLKTGDGQKDQVQASTLIKRLKGIQRQFEAVLHNV